MKLKNVKHKFTGGIDGGNGWKGDVKNMLLEIGKLKSLGWKLTQHQTSCKKDGKNTYPKKI